MIVATLFVLLYCLAGYGFSLFLYEHYINDDDPAVEDIPPALIHVIIFLFSVFWFFTIGIVSIIRVFKR